MHLLTSLPPPGGTKENKETPVLLLLLFVVAILRLSFLLVSFGNPPSLQLWYQQISSTHTIGLAEGFVSKERGGQLQEACQTGAHSMMTEGSEKKLSCFNVAGELEEGRHLPFVWTSRSTCTDVAVYPCRSYSCGIHLVRTNAYTCLCLCRYRDEGTYIMQAHRYIYVYICIPGHTSLCR